MANDRSFRIALIYFIFAVLWITLSDRIDFLEFDYEYYQTIKGLFFVTASSVLIYVALRIEARHRRKVERAHAIVASRERLLISELGASLWQWNGRTNTTRFTEESKRLIGEDASFPISVEAWLARIHPDDIGAVRTAMTIPVFCLALPAGVWADRFDRRTWLVSSQLLLLGIAGLMAVLAATASWSLGSSCPRYWCASTMPTLYLRAWERMIPTLRSK